MELNFTVTNQRIKYVSNLYIVEKSRNYLTAKFSFSGSEWKNVAKTAIFKKDDNVINVLLDENGRCPVPWELITKGTLKVSVFGGDLVTVDTAEVKILKSGYEEGNAPSEPTSDVYAQILAELQSIRDDFITEEMLGQAVEDWLAENVVEALSPADVEKIVYDYLDEHKGELKGEKGAVFTPHVSDEGVMSWTNDGGLENPPPVDLKINVGGEYALLTEAGYSLALSIDSNYVMTISLKNKAGEVLDSKHIDFPIESMVVNATYADGVVTFTLQNGNVLDVDISDLVRGLVPTSRTIAGVDLADDITAEELKDALGMYDEGLTAGTLKPWLYDTENEVEIGIYNGKPLYRKTVVFPLTSFTGAAGLVFDAENNIEYYEHIYLSNDSCILTGNKSVSNQSIPLNYYLQGDVYVRTNIQFNNDLHWYVYIMTNLPAILENASTAQLRAVIEYTKTTDLEGSGNSLNPYGIYDAKLDDVKSSIASVSDEVDAVNNSLIATDATVINYNVNNKAEALAYLNNPTTIPFIGARTRCYNFLFADSVGDSPFGGGYVRISGYTYSNNLYGMQMAYRFGQRPKWRSNNNGVWSEWDDVGTLAEVTALQKATESDIEAINSRLEANKSATRQSIIDTTSTSKYTCPCDGYVYINVKANSRLYCYIYDSAGVVIGMIGIGGGSEYAYNDTLFVKKGMLLCMEDNTDTTMGSCNFIGLDG